MTADIKDPAYPEAFDPFGKRPHPLPPWRSMSEFDPSKPAILHDAVNDIEVEWSGDTDEWRKVTVQHTENVIGYDGYLIDRWREPVKH